jgi:hypothetical protein
MSHFRCSCLKIERANKHIADVNKLISALPKSHVSTVELNPNPPGNEAIKHDIRNRDKIVDNLALIIGDAVHNLKCALDYAWIGALERFVPDALGNFAKFPVFSTRYKLENALVGRKINTAAPKLYKRIVCDIQPYHGGNDSIWAVHRLDILDKHRLLVPVIEFVSITGIEVENERGEIERGGFTWATAQKAPFYIPIPPQWHVKNKGQLTIGIAFDEGTPSDGMDVADMLATYSIQVLNVVQVLEQLVTVGS